MAMRFDICFEEVASEEMKSRSKVMIAFCDVDFSSLRAASNIPAV